MDPNANLATLRADVQAALTEVYRDEDMSLTRGETLEELLREVAETFDNLDQWLTKGGFLPTAWERAK